MTPSFKLGPRHGISIPFSDTSRKESMRHQCMPLHGKEEKKVGGGRGNIKALTNFKHRVSLSSVAAPYSSSGFGCMKQTLELLFCIYRCL